MQVPSLYINYRLKSVAHMPARAMMYKFLNTFIDDLFAFTIKMPMLHRLATLRDDIIFFFYLYQAWAYKVSPADLHPTALRGIVTDVFLHRSITRESTSSAKAATRRKLRTRRPTSLCKRLLMGTPRLLMLKVMELLFPLGKTRVRRRRGSSRFSRHKLGS